LTQLDVGSAPAESALRTNDRPQDHSGVGAARWWALLAVVVLVSAIAVWIISPRFAIDSPSLVDDWSAISKSRAQLSEIVRLQNPEEQRFRPGWIAWNYLQWHTLDAPQGLIGPNLWNVTLRILVLVGGLALLTALALPRPRRARESVLYAGLAGIPALLVVTVPKFGVDLARFGPQEPLLVGAMALGGSLLVIVARALLDEARAVSPWKLSLLTFLGSLLWILGVYQKETSLAALPLIASVVYVGRSRLGIWNSVSASRRAVLWGLCAVVVLPFAHIAVEAGRIAARGDLVYDAEVAGGRGIVDGLFDLYDWSHEALPRTARLAMLGAVILVALVAVLRRKLDIVAVGALSSGALALVLVAQSGTVATRYYLPAYALFAVALSLSLARLPAPFPLASLLAIVVVQVAGLLSVALPQIPPPGARDEVKRWAASEEQSAELVRNVADLESSGCFVAAAGLQREASEALPVVIAVRQRGVPRACAANGVYFVVGPLEEGAALARACASGARRPLVDGGELATLDLCTRLRSGQVRDPALGLMEPEALVALRRLRAGS
jgi:hypothetical protein